ncbi:MAG: hypothetical protein ACPIOQ_61110, partial [Promethearchaeia archaeon]
MPKDSKGSIVPSSSIKGKTGRKYANFEPTIEAPLSPPVIVDGDGTNRSGSALNVYEERYQGTREGRSPKTRVKSSPGGEHKAAGRQEHGTEFYADGIDEETLSLSELLDRCRRLKESEGAKHAELRRVQCELHAFVSFPFDVTEERRDKARATMSQVVAAERAARAEIARVTAELHQARAVAALQSKSSAGVSEGNGEAAAAAAAGLTKQVEALSQQLQGETGRADELAARLRAAEEECRRLRQASRELGDEAAVGQEQLAALEAEVEQVREEGENEVRALEDTLEAMEAELSAAREAARLSSIQVTSLVYLSIYLSVCLSIYLSIY